jgi:endonuclease/exonuclease/phosphatase family metal-dependent hydrolase
MNRACLSQRRDKLMGPMIKVASYNIRKALGTDRRRLPERIIDVLNEVDADVFALQEADRRFGVRHAVLPDRLLEMYSDYRAVEIPTRAESMGWHGNALLVRRGQADVHANVIHLPCLEPRGAVTAALDIGGIRIRMVGMHLDLSGLWRRRQATAVQHHIAMVDVHDPAHAVIVMGDTNEWTSNRGCLLDFSRHYQIASCGRSFHSRRQVAELDRIMWRDQLQLVDSGVHVSTLARRASDHLPVWATFDIT